MTVEEYEAEILAHRYLYYVLAQPALRKIGQGT